jgi:putative ABC transport system substrate-binding protein
MPVIGFLSPGSERRVRYLAAALRQGLSDGGFVEGRDLAIEYRWAGGEYDRLPALAADLARKRVALIVTAAANASLAAKAATATIPVVFVTGIDPIEAGLVTSFNRPEANLTGIYIFSSGLSGKRLQLLQEMVPAAERLAVLVNHTSATARRDAEDVQAAAASIGRRIRLLNVSTDRELDAAFATTIEQRIGGLVVQTEPFLNSRYERLVLHTTRHGIPTISGIREFPLAGGLMSYGASLTTAWRQVGAYAARILRGETPADLPVLQPTKFELVINLQAAKVLGLTVPNTLLVSADEVIE